MLDIFLPEHNNQITNIWTTDHKSVYCDLLEAGKWKKNVQTMMLVLDNEDNNNEDNDNEDNNNEDNDNEDNNNKHNDNEDYNNNHDHNEVLQFCNVFINFFFVLDDGKIPFTLQRAGKSNILKRSLKRQI